MKEAYEEKLSSWRENMIKNTEDEQISDTIIKRIQQPSKFGTPKFDLNTHKIEIVKNEIKKTKKNFPLFFDENYFGNKELKCRWKFAAMRKAAVIYDEDKWLKIGIKEGKNSNSLLPNTKVVTLDFTFFSKSDKNLFLKFDYSDAINFGVLHNFDFLELESWSKGEVRVDYELKAIPYSFPGVKVEIYDNEDKEKILKKLDLSIPITYNWFKRPVKLKTDYIEKSILEAQGIFLQSDFYNLDKEIAKSKNELRYLIREFKEINPEVSHPDFKFITENRLYAERRPVPFGPWCLL